MLIIKSLCKAAKDNVIVLKAELGHIFPFASDQGRISVGDAIACSERPKIVSFGVCGRWRPPPLFKIHSLGGSHLSVSDISVPASRRPLQLDILPTKLIMASVSSLDKDLRGLRLDKYTPQRANEARKWIEEMLDEKLEPGDLVEALKDGTALCKYAAVAGPIPWGA
jgi:hypothetical protein